MHVIYLDTNVYCRPRDDRSQRRINKEAKALEEIAKLKEEKKVFVVSSDYVKIELREIEDREKQEDIQNFERALSSTNFEHSDKAKILATEITEKCRIGVLDSLHLSAAALSNAGFFLTCDEGVIAEKDCITRVLKDRGHFVSVLNPLDYLESEWEMRIG